MCVRFSSQVCFRQYSFFCYELFQIRFNLLTYFNSQYLILLFILFIILQLTNLLFSSTLLFSFSFILIFAATIVIINRFLIYLYYIQIQSFQNNLRLVSPISITLKHHLTLLVNFKPIFSFCMQVFSFLITFFFHFIFFFFHHLVSLLPYNIYHF